MAAEYIDTVTVNLSEMRKIQRAQQEIYNKGIKVSDRSALIDALGPVSSILGLAFIKSTPVGIATGVIGLATSMLSPSEKSILKNLVYDGYYEMGFIISFMEDHPKFDSFVVELPFIEYSNQGVRFVAGKGKILRAHVKSGSGWVKF